jgi:hypothetical protein
MQSEQLESGARYTPLLAQALTGATPAKTAVVTTADGGDGGSKE